MANHEQLEMQFNEKNEAIVPEAPANNAAEPTIVSEIHIRRLEDGRLDIYVPEQYGQMHPSDVEITTRQVYEELRDMRIASNAIEMFKKRLG